MFTLWVHFLGHFESVGVGQVSVGWSDSQDQTAFLGDELQQHVSDLVFNIYGLVSDRHLGHSREVNQGQVQHYITQTEIIN